jgi:hypothetical protein
MAAEGVAVREASKEQFKEMYFTFGHARDGWSQDYWDKFFEPEPPRPMKYLIEEPESAAHDRMMIVCDSREYRLFFLTEEAEERFFHQPGAND